MPKAGLTAVRLRNHIVKVIHRVGLPRALAHRPTGIAYSGPFATYVGIVGYDRNSQKSEEMALRLGASRINDTWMARKLATIDLDDYFRPVYARLIRVPSKLNTVLRAAYNTVWGGVSTEFAKLPFQEIATAVCGASKRQVFIRYELQELVQNPHIEICNKIPMDAVRRMYNEVGKDEAYNLVCLSELHMAFRYASGSTARPVHAWQDFSDRIQFYQGERSFTAPVRQPLTADQEQRKQEIIADFGLNALYATAPATWGGPVAVVRSAATRPLTYAVA